MAAFFADSGFDAHLVDISHSALRISRANFEADGLAASTIVADAFALPYHDAQFNVVVSIGLLEHFANVRQLIVEQVRVLKAGGLLLAYVVPQRSRSVQTLAKPVNWLLMLEHQSRQSRGDGKAQRAGVAKQELFRNDFTAQHYLRILHDLSVSEAGSMGMFPLPLVSHSYEFPFTPMSTRRERALVAIWRVLLGLRGRFVKEPWACAEGWGLAFLVWARK
jgi:SAM-dependent methyltransferase